MGLSDMLRDGQSEAANKVLAEAKQVIEIKKTDIPPILDSIDKAFSEFLDSAIRELTKEE